MENKYFTVNIQEYLEKEEYISRLKIALDSFNCSINKEVENFLKVGAIESAKQGKAVTYLVFTDDDNPGFVGYFTLAIKPITVHRMFINAKYAQLGKNFSNGKTIKGSDLLQIAEGEIRKLKSAVGGVAVFLECEEIPQLQYVIRG